MSLPRGHGDETPTGHLDVRLRGLRRVTLAGWTSDEGYDWLMRFYAEYLGDGDHAEAEPKSARVLKVIVADARARDKLLRDLCRATIVIIDMAQYVRDTVHEVAEALDLDQRLLPADPIDLLARSPESPALKRLATLILDRARDRAIDGTILGRIEDYVLEASRTFLPLRGRVLDRQALREMGDAEFRTVAARFAATLGEALRPEKLEHVLKRYLRDHRYVPSVPYIAVRSIDAELERAHVFDEGEHRAFIELEASRQRLEDLLNETPFREFRRPAGPIEEEDSRRVLGLQAADIAAGVARDAFERTNGDTRMRAEAVRRIFDRVLLNDRWL